MKSHGAASGTVDQPLEQEILELAQNYLRARANDYAFTSEEQQSWLRFHQRCDPLVRRIVHGHGLSGPDADDCVQDAWIALIHRLRRFRYDPTRGRFETWLYAVVHGVTVDEFRRRARRPVNASLTDELPAQASPGSGEVTAAEAARRLLAQARRRLSPISFAVLEMRCFNDQPVEEVATRLGLTREQVWAPAPRQTKAARPVAAHHHLPGGQWHRRPARETTHTRRRSSSDICPPSAPLPPLRMIRAYIIFTDRGSSGLLRLESKPRSHYDWPASRICSE